MPQLVGKICLVTGATRGIGKGIALQLGASGATVYVTGRTLKKSSSSLGSLEDTADEINSRGGKCIPVECDHSKDDQVQKLFEQIKSEQNGRLDILVNNAYAAVTSISKYLNVSFWEQPVTMWDDVNNVGLRNHYLCTVYAARLMAARQQGLIVNVSSMGGLRYLFNVPYGVGKEALDRMAADCAHELRKYNVACVSLWPGAVMTEFMSAFKKSPKASKQFSDMFTEDNTETVEFAGLAVSHLAADSSIMKKSGRILLTGDLADEYGFQDVNGKLPPSSRSVSFLLPHIMPSFPFLQYFPRCFKLPRWVLALYGNKF